MTQPELDENSPAVQNAGQRFYEQGLAVNLEEVTADTLTVALREFTVNPETGKRKSVWRTVELETFVPMAIFNTMMAGRSKVMRRTELRQVATDQGGEIAEDDPQLAWMLDCVWRVWKLTPDEEDMTIQTLKEGLSFKKIQGLFVRFFGDFLYQQISKAAPDGNTTSAAASVQE